MEFPTRNQAVKTVSIVMIRFESLLEITLRETGVFIPSIWAQLPPLFVTLTVMPVKKPTSPL